MKVRGEIVSFPPPTKTDIAAGVRNMLRDAFVRSVEGGGEPTAWSLRIGFIELIKRDTYLALGYKPDKIESFMGLPIIIAPVDEKNRLITSTTGIAICEIEPVQQAKSYAND